jgi:hypothetical protein
MADNTAVCPLKSILRTLFSLIQLLNDHIIYLDTLESFYNKYQCQSTIRYILSYDFDII